MLFERISRNFSKFFAIFWRFRKFLQVFGPALTCWDVFGRVWIHSDASGCARCVQMHWDVFGKFSKQTYEKSNFCNFRWFFKEPCKNGRHQHVPRLFSLPIHLFKAWYDPWSSSWDRVASWDGLCERHWPPGGHMYGGMYGCVCWPSP